MLNTIFAFACLVSELILLPFVTLFKVNQTFVSSQLDSNLRLWGHIFESLILNLVFH